MKYNPNMVKETSFYALISGISSEFVRSELKTDLENMTISDEELIEKVNIASQQEEDRKQKLRSSKINTTVKVHEVETETET